MGHHAIQCHPPATDTVAYFRITVSLLVTIALEWAHWNDTNAHLRVKLKCMGKYFKKLTNYLIGYCYSLKMWKQWAYLQALQAKRDTHWSPFSMKSLNHCRLRWLRGQCSVTRPWYAESAERKVWTTNMYSGTAATSVQVRTSWYIVSLVYLTPSLTPSTDCEVLWTFFSCWETEQHAGL